MMFPSNAEAENVLQAGISQAVIGPINFGASAAKRPTGRRRAFCSAPPNAPVSKGEFQFEPVAAGLDFEATLSEEQTVLVVDIGGGTTDCSVLLMGPQWRDRADRPAEPAGPQRMPGRR